MKSSYYGSQEEIVEMAKLSGQSLPVFPSATVPVVLLATVLKAPVCEKTVMTMTLTHLLSNAQLMKFSANDASRMALYGST